MLGGEWGRRGGSVKGGFVIIIGVLHAFRLVFTLCIGSKLWVIMEVWGVWGGKAPDTVHNASHHYWCRTIQTKISNT